MSSILKVDTIQDQSGNNIINESGNVITIGASGDTITVPAGATVSGFTSAGIDDNATSVAITISSDEDVTFTEDILLGDSKKAIFGAGSDLQIYHDGSNSYVDDAGSGRLFLRGNDRVQIQKYTGEDMINCLADGAVNIYYDNAKKFETTATGVAVTGSIGVDGAATFNESSADVDFRVESNDNANMLFVDGGANTVGIGIADPVAQLTVGSNNSGGQGVAGKTALFSGTVTSVYNSGNSGSWGGITIVNSDSTSNRTTAGVTFVNGSSGVASIQSTSDTSSRADLRFITRGADNSGNTSERMRIADNGSVLIGTSTSGSAVAGDLVVNGGVFLGGTAAANELDDYEEGSFTPSFSASGCSFNYTQRFGNYTKVGRVVHCKIFMRAQSSGSTSQDLKITGLPFTSSNTSGLFASCTFGQIYRVDLTDAERIVGQVSQNTTTIDLQYTVDDAASGNLIASTLDNSTSSGFIIDITYFTDA